MLERSKRTEDVKFQVRKSIFKKGTIKSATVLHSFYFIARESSSFKYGLNLFNNRNQFNLL